MTHVRTIPLLALSSLFLYLSSFVQVLAQDPQSRTETFEGVVRPLSEIAKSRKISSDSEPLAGLMALETKDGRAIPLLSDEGGRMYYLDKAMRGRQVRLKMIERPDFPVAEVIQSEVMHEGRWRVPQYYCDVCTIAVRYPQVCLCCQGPMEFRYRPER
ncbi:hypothetical protein GC170_20055 [bacterium]|nr:hypothetical protein [bacterium]